jgi:predicted anti-sigma-YlaC factor YlaD
MFALVSDDLDLELPPDTCRDIHAHMAGCSPCAELTESLRETIELCREYAQEMPGPLAQDARQKLAAAYRRMLEQRRR